MFINKNKTLKDKNHSKQQWYVIDAKNKNLGRLSSKISHKLRGKDNPRYLPYEEKKINIIVINSKHIEITGNKRKQKLYIGHSGRPGGLKVKSFNKVQNDTPNKIIKQAVKGMLSKNSLGNKLLNKLKVYSDAKHPHNAQKPMLLDIN